MNTATGAARFHAKLPRRFQERKTLDIADGASDLHDNDIRALGHRFEAGFDLVCDVGDHLDRTAEIITATLLGDHRFVNLPRGDVRRSRKLDAGKALIVTQVHVGLRAVVGDEHFAVLVGAHRPGIDVDVGIELEERDAVAVRLQQSSYRSRGQSFPQR